MRIRKKRWKRCISCGSSFAGRQQEWCEECDTPFFIKRANITHGNKYNYKNSEYTGSNEKLEIICPEHGSFWQRSYNHLRGEGCPGCAGLKQLTNKEFIQRAQKIHGNTYEYDLADYKNFRTKVEIKCYIHGVFSQLPSVHLSGGGCPKCAIEKKYTTSDFIEKADEIHENKYEYHKVKYIDGMTKVTIKCRKHGYFEQVPKSHIAGSGCPDCAGKNYSLKDFIINSKAMHGNRYNYSQVDYINSYTKVKIQCKKHGFFEQQPNNHLLGVGCPACGLENRCELSDFTKKAIQVHGNRYEYNHINYIDGKSIVKIICKKHGYFFQTPNTHLLGKGCPYCAGTRRLTTSSFIRKARELHGTNNNYSQVQYVDSKTKVKLRCKFHSYFYQLPGNHLSGSGCPACNKKDISKTSEFIKKARKVHGNKYSYKEVSYTYSRTKVKIKCKKHGFFYQTPFHHLRGHGCRDCGNTRKLTNEDFFQKAIKQHGNKYKYNDVNYINSTTKVKIECSKHGYFNQAPSSHLRGEGCPFCARKARSTKQSKT